MSIIEVLGLVIIGLHGAALAVVNATDTPKDNTSKGKAYRLLEIAAGVITRKVKK